MLEVKSSVPSNLENLGYGLNHILNFGKYKMKSIYDVANEDKDIGYAKWLLTSSNMNPVTLSHVKAVVDNWNKNGLWIQNKIQDEKSQRVYCFEKKDSSNQVNATGPIIEERPCKVCNKFKFKTYLNPESICIYCAQNRTVSKNIYPGVGEKT